MIFQRFHRDFKMVLCFGLAIISGLSTIAQSDTLQNKTIPIMIQTDGLHVFKPRQFIAPTAFLGLGFAGLCNNTFHDLNISLQSHIAGTQRIYFDDYLQYSPMVAAYALDMFGIRGTHNLRDKTVILATSYVLMAASVRGIKFIVKEPRPDTGVENSFPSGHTATVFMGATFLWMEYKDCSPWIGVAGYAVAATTGYLRIYNNRHYTTDVLTGAGLGILSTRIAYWVYPYLQNFLFPNQAHCTVKAMPYYDGQSQSLGLCCSFKF